MHNLIIIMMMMDADHPINHLELSIWFQATVLEEMPPFPERESSILAILKKKKPGRVAEPGGGAEGATPGKERKSPALNSASGGSTNHHNNSAQSADLLGLTSPSSSSTSTAPAGSGHLVDVLADVFNNSSSSPNVNNGFGASFQPIDNLKK